MSLFGDKNCSKHRFPLIYEFVFFYYNFFCKSGTSFMFIIKYLIFCIEGTKGGTKRSWPMYPIFTLNPVWAKIWLRNMTDGLWFHIYWKLIFIFLKKKKNYPLWEGTRVVDNGASIFTSVLIFLEILKNSRFGEHWGFFSILIHFHFN